MDNHCVMCGAYLADTGRMVCEKCEKPKKANKKRLYTSHKVAEIIADLLGDSCACNFNGNDEWLPFKCELQDCCPNTFGVACWEQYLKHRDCKEEILKNFEITLEAKKDG